MGAHEQKRPAQRVRFPERMHVSELSGRGEAGRNYEEVRDELV